MSVRSYDLGLDPPAPIAEVTVSDPTKAAAHEPPAGKLDTGADITVIPTWLVTRLGLRPRGRAWTRSFDGSFSPRLVYYPRLSVEGYDLPAVRCVATDRRDVLLGRNVLNRFVIVLNGPELRFEMTQLAGPTDG
jgi:Aspartyl protease